MFSRTKRRTKNKTEKIWILSVKPNLKPADRINFILLKGRYFFATEMRRGNSLSSAVGRRGQVFT
jgi:hypothetical protein